MAIPAIGNPRLAILHQPSKPTASTEILLEMRVSVCPVLVQVGPLLVLTPSASGANLLQGDDPQ